MSHPKFCIDKARFGDRVTTNEIKQSEVCREGDFGLLYPQELDLGALNSHLTHLTISHAHSPEN
jgi:hypothetical protein